jgi:dCMP deaminase
MTIPKHTIFLNIAEEISHMSHCISHKVGCILVKNGRIISTGYNGTPEGCDNCDNVNYNLTDLSIPSQREQHHDFSEKYEIHAELNAILCAAKNGISIKDSILYCTLQPCYNCLKAICNSGIKTIIYRYKYDKFNMTPELQKILTQCNISLIHESEL